MQFPFSLYPLGLADPFRGSSRAREYFNSLPEEKQLELLRRDITAGDFEHEVEILKMRE